jgi:hypothetical protein
MSTNDYNDNQRGLDAEQKIDAGQRVGSGWSVADVAQHYGLTETELRIELGLPQWQPEPVQEPERTLFNMGGK